MLNQLKKKTRVIKRKTSINRIRIGKYKSAVSEIEKAIKSKDLNKAKKLFNNLQSVLMKTSKKGSIKRKTASRKISRISKKIFSKKN
ncbi:MAG: 30S ribosomal protein S20 [Candidatus Pelagibacter sp.]|nr:30S ribosomal protein S20 [Candidatus Pelagibacter sp.]